MSSVADASRRANNAGMTARVRSVHRSPNHTIAKPASEAIRLVPGLGVEGDAHFGATVMHRYDRSRDPQRPNLRQVHLIQSELLDELAGKGFSVAPGQMGENVSTAGIDVLSLSRGTRLRLGAEALIEVTGTRNPCRLIDEASQPGVMAATLEKRADGTILRKTGVMAVILEGGEVRAGDAITVDWLPAEHVPLEPV